MSLRTCIGSRKLAFSVLSRLVTFASKIFLNLLVLGILGYPQWCLSLAVVLVASDMETVQDVLSASPLKYLTCVAISGVTRKLL